MPHDDPAPVDDDRVRLLLVHLGAAMIATGQPVNEIEEELEEVGAHLGYPHAQVGAAPTGLMLSLRSGEPAAYESVTAKVRLDQASEVRRIRHQLVFAELTVHDAFDQLSRLRSKPPSYPSWLTKVAWVFVATGIGFILQPGWANVAAVVVCAIAVLGLNSLAGRAQVMATLLPTIAAFVVTVIVFLAADLGWIEGP